jgi:DNA-binding NtrC family response regulator
MGVRMGSADLSLTEATCELHRRMILRALKQGGGIKTEAARLLGIHESTLRKKMRTLDIQPDKDV